MVVCIVPKASWLEQSYGQAPTSSKVPCHGVFPSSLPDLVRPVQTCDARNEDLVPVVERDVAVGHAGQDLGHVGLGVQELAQVDEEAEVRQDVDEGPACPARASSFVSTS